VATPLRDEILPPSSQAEFLHLMSVPPAATDSSACAPLWLTAIIVGVSTLVFLPSLAGSVSDDRLTHVTATALAAPLASRYPTGHVSATFSSGSTFAFHPIQAEGVIGATARVKTLAQA
jgi:hypothetical protein